MANNISSSSLAMVQLLLSRGADLHTRKYSAFSVILTAAHCDGKSPDLPVLDFLLERDDITRADKIDALEMVGAVLLGNEESSEEMISLAFRYWRRALTLRLMDTREFRPIHKTPTKSKSGQLSEWTTLDDLLQLEKDPAQREMQSILVRHRIFTSLSWSAVYDCFLPVAFKFLLKGLAQLRTIPQVLDLSWMTLDSILRSERPHECHLQSALHKFVAMPILTLGNLPKGDPNLVPENVKKLVELVLMTDPSYLFDPEQKPLVAETCHIENLCEMMMILSRHPELITEEIRLYLLQLVHRDGRDESGLNIMHIAIRIPDSEALSTIRFLVNLGVNPNAGNSVGDGVLHMLALEPESENRDATAHLLLELGAHLDMVNKDGKTAADLWLKKNKLEKKDVGHLPDWLQEGVPKLMCLSSRVIRRYKLPHNDGNTFPAVLIPFVSLH